MDPSRNTGPIVPGWIREQIARHEAAWPLLALGGGVLVALAMSLAMGALIWTADSAAYYARP